MQFDEVDQETRAWLEEHLAKTPDFIRTYSPADAEKPPSVSALDRSWTAFMQLGIEDSEQVNEAIHIVGFNLGLYLVKNAGFEWTISTDDYGTELAIVALRDQGNVVICPADFVAKRWHRKETDFLVDAVKQIIQQKNQVEAQWKAGNN